MPFPSLVLALTLLSSPASPHLAPEPALSAAPAVFALGDHPDLRGTPLAAFEIESPVRKPGGAIFGAVEFLGARADAVLHPVQPGIDGGNEGWILSIEATSARLSDLIPTLKGSLLDDLRLRRTALVLSTGNVRVDEATMSPEVSAFYAPYFKSARLMLEVAGGVNLITRMQPGDGSPVGEALARLGLESDGILLQGTLLKDASFSDLKKAHKDKDLKRRLAESMELRAYLPAVDLPGLPDHFIAGETSLIVGGKPNIGLAFRLVTEPRNGGEAQAFECRVDVAKTPLGATELQVLGTALGTWNDAFGIGGFDLEDPRLLLEVDNASRIGFGVRAGLGLGSKEMAVSAKLQLHAVTGVPLGGFFEGRLNSIGSHDLVAFANGLARSRGLKPMPDSALPDFELRDLYLKFAPTEGDSDLGTSEGFALRGELHAFDTQLAYVDGSLTLGGLIPDLSLVGECGDVDLGAVALKDAAVDIRLGATLDQHFRLKGATKLLALERSIDVNCSLKNLVIDTSETFRGVYSTAYHLSSPAAGRPAWRLKATVENHLSETLAKDVSRHARAWAEKVERDFAKAQKNLDNAKAEVRQLDDHIEREKKGVLARRAKQAKGLRKAQASVKKLDGELAEVRTKILKKRKERWAKVKKKKDAMNRAERAWRKAVKARKKAKLHKRPKLRVIEAAKFTDYQAKKTAYGTAHANYKVLLKVPIEADPRSVAILTARETALGALRAAEKLTEVWPLETDPKVAALITAKGTALAGLNVAKASVFVSGKAVVGAGKITAWLAEHNGDIFMLDSASFDAELAGYLGGNRITLHTKARFLGERKTFTLKVASGSLKDGKLGKALWSHLKKELEA